MKVHADLHRKTRQGHTITFYPEIEELNRFQFLRFGISEIPEYHVSGDYVTVTVVYQKYPSLQKFKYTFLKHDFQVLTSCLFYDQVLPVDLKGKTGPYDTLIVTPELDEAESKSLFSS